jgi:plastocyanin
MLRKPKETPMRAPSLTIVVFTGLFMGLSVGAFAANLTITQKGRVFSSDEVSIKKGETLTFLNDDSVPHNIMSTSKGNEFNLGSQPPGSSTDVTFKEPGEMLVFCAIHPRMKMIVKVTE